MYIKKLRRRWYAMHEIPDDVRAALGGKRRFKVSLGTEDKTEAKRRAAIHEQRWLRAIAQARDAKEDPIERDAQYWRSLYLQAETEDEKQLLEWQIGDLADGLIHRSRIMDPEHPEFEEQPEVKDGRRFYGIATAQVVKTADMVEEWLVIKGNLKDKQRDMYRSDLRRFSERFPYVEDVTRKAATQWVNDLMAGPDGLKLKTVQRMLAAVRGYWRHLENMEVVPAEFDPFKGLAKGSKGSSNGQRGTRFDRWRVFDPDDVVRLLRAAEAKGDAKLAEVIRLGMWTGCRIEELCSLKVENVHDGHFEVVDAKTEAGWREVPIHSRLAPIMAELVKASKDGFVVSDLTRNKYGDRSNAVGKRFGRLKTELGFEERFVFHSIRKCVVTQLERAGVPENVAADIVGHDKPTMTYGTYGNRNRLETLKQAVELLAYDDGTPKYSP